MQAKTCGLRINEHLEELENITSTLFPCEMFDNHLSASGVSELSWHWHGEIELIYVNSGILSLHCNDQTYMIHEKQGAFINANMLHCATLKQGKDCRFHSILFNPSLLSNQRDTSLEHPYIQTLLQAPIACLVFAHPLAWQVNVLQQMKDALQCYEQEQFAYELYIRARLSDIWYAICHYALTPENKTIQDINTQRMKTMLAYIYEHYHTPLTLHEIATSASISDRECIRCFKKQINYTPMQYVMKYRIELALHHLANGNDTIEQIASNIGFDSPSYFTYLFKRITSRTPSQYRKDKAKVE